VALVQESWGICRTAHTTDAVLEQQSPRAGRQAQPIPKTREPYIRMTRVSFGPTDEYRVQQAC